MYLEAFVYCWTDHSKNMLYVGSHKGPTDDGYICSSKYMKEEYKKRPQDFTRQIIAEGRYQDIRKLEMKILVSVDAKLDEQFYNKSNGKGDYKLSRLGSKHTTETKEKMSLKRHGKGFTELHRKNMAISKLGNKNSLGRILSESTKEKISKSHLGKKHSEETKFKLSISRMGENNPNYKGGK